MFFLCFESLFRKISHCGPLELCLNLAEVSCQQQHFNFMNAKYTPNNQTGKHARQGVAIQFFEMVSGFVHKVHTFREGYKTLNLEDFVSSFVVLSEHTNFTKNFDIILPWIP